jgi:hypothetical protein
MIVAHFRPGTALLEKVAHQWSEESCGFAQALEGPSVAVVGWVPSYQAAEQLPAGFLRRQWDADPAIARLLETGNQKPPESFADDLDFARHLNSRDFRGALCIHRPTVYLDAAGLPVQVSCYALARAGCTAVRVKSVVWFSGGAGLSSGYFAEARSSVTIRVFLRMKIGALGQAVGKLLTGHWPPWATLMIDYSIDYETGLATIVYSGTPIPSQCRYVEWKLDSEYQIETDMSAAAYKLFVKAGGCLDAMAQPMRMTVPVLKWEAERAEE